MEAWGKSWEAEFGDVPCLVLLHEGTMTVSPWRIAQGR